MMSPASDPPSERLIQELEARLREVDLVVGMRVMESWAYASELSLEEARILLVLASRAGPSTARELADLSGISVNDIYPRLHGLAARGDIRETERRYSLTERGGEAVAALEQARRAGVADYVAELDPEDRNQLESALGLDSG